MNLKFSILSIALFLLGCEKSNDEHVFTLYSSYHGNRMHVASFDATPTSWGDNKINEQFTKMFSEDNFNGCQKVADLLKKDWDESVKNNDIKYWCEKGKFRK